MILAYMIFICALASLVCPVSAYLCHVASVPIWAGILWGLWFSFVVVVARWLREPETWKKTLS